MFTDNELRVTIDMSKRKFNDILETTKELNADDILNMQTLLVIRDAAEKKLRKRN